MYRDDQEALRHRVDSMEREADDLRRENEAMRLAVSEKQELQQQFPTSLIYQSDVRLQPLTERARLANHSLTTFPVWAAGLLTPLTLGLFPLIHFGLMHDRLPQAAVNDPSAAKSIGFQFIPYYNLYWMFFNTLRLSDRVDLQLRLRNLPRSAPKGLFIAACVVTVIPYLGLLALPTLWTIASCRLQHSINKVAKLSPTDWSTHELPKHAGETPYQAPNPHAMAAVAQPMHPAVAEEQAKAAKLVSLSHKLGWGGIAALVVGTTLAGVTIGAPAAAVVAACSGVSIVAGAIVGQVGRGMQGRVI